MFKQGEFEFAKPSDKEKDVGKEIAKGDAVTELKYDGTRAIIIQRDSTEIVNRRGNRKIEQYPEFQDLQLERGTVIDGEIIIQTEEKPTGDFEKLLSRDNLNDRFKQKLMAKKVPAVFVAFDILEKGGVSHEDKHLQERRRILQDVVDRANGNIQISRQGDFTDVWKFVVKNNLEGVVVKRNTEYPHGRTEKWLKVKNRKEDVVKVVDYEEHPKGITAITEGEHRINVPRNAEKVKEKAPVKIEIEYLEKTANGNYRQPVFKKVIG